MESFETQSSRQAGMCSRCPPPSRAMAGKNTRRVLSARREARILARRKRIQERLAAIREGTGEGEHAAAVTRVRLEGS